MGGPIACGIDAGPLLNWETGTITKKSESTDHVISVVGWGKDYWIVRNSWGEYWGDMGYVNVGFGALNIEDQCSWATVDIFTALEKKNQVHCHEGGDNCKAQDRSNQAINSPVQNAEANITLSESPCYHPHTFCSSSKQCCSHHCLKNRGQSVGVCVKDRAADA